MRLDRIIYLQQPVVARDNFGSEVTTWTTRAEVWASFENVGKNTERYIRNASTTHVFRMGRYEIRRPTVNFNELWRIVEKDDGRVWDVVGIDKVPPEPETFEAKGAQEESPEKQELPKPTRAE